VTDEELLAAIFATGAGDALLVVDHELRIQRASAEAAELAERSFAAIAADPGKPG